MADDLKTMSGFVMGLLDRMDEEDEKYKGLIPGTNIPSVMSQFQDIPQGPQMVPDSPQLFRSQMTVPELEQFKVPKKSTPPIVPVPEKPYEGSKQYVQDYFSRNQSRLPDRDPVPPTVYTLDEGIPIPAYTTDTPKTQLSMEVPTFQGPVPEPYQDAGEYMRNYFSRNQSNLEDAREESRLRKERKSMLRSDGTIKDQTGFLGPIPTDDGRVMTEQTIGVEIDGEKVNIPALVPGLDEYEVGLLASGNVDWNSIVGKGMQEKAVNHYKFRKSRGLDPYYKEGEVAPPYYLANRGSRIPEGILPEFGTFRDPSEYIPKPNIPEEKTGFSKFFSFEGGSKLDSERLTNESFIQPEQDIEGLMSKQAGEDASDREDLVSGDLTVRQYERNKVKREEELANAREKQAIHERQTLGMLNQRVDQLEAAGLTEEANKVRSQIPKPKGPKVPELEVKPPLRVVTTEETEASGELIGSDTSKQVDESLKVSGVQSGGKVVTTTNTETGEEEVVVVDEKGDEKPGFFKSLWNGIKDIAKEGFEDPSLRKALFAYTASRVLGYDGVTLASAVLENEWQKQAAQAKADRELEKLYGEKQAKLILDKRVDPTKVFTVYDSQTKTNLTGSTSKDGTLFYPDNPSVFGIEAGSPVDLSKLRTFDDGRFEPQAGKTMAELQGEYLEFAGNKSKAIIAQIKQRNSSMESTQLDDLVSQMQAATNENILSEPLMTFLSTLPAGVDPNDKFVREASANGIREWLKSFESGQTVDSKDLVGFLDAQRMKLDLTSNGIPQAYFKIPADKKGEAQVGNNALSMIMNGIENSPHAKDLGLSTEIILSKMADIYGKKVINEKGFQSRMNGYSKDSFSEGDKSKFVSPFFAFVQKSFASDNEDIAELMAELKK